MVSSTGSRPSLEILFVVRLLRPPELFVRSYSPKTEEERKGKWNTYSDYVQTFACDLQLSNRKTKLKTTACRFGKFPRIWQLGRLRYWAAYNIFELQRPSIRMLSNWLYNMRSTFQNAEFSRRQHMFDEQETLNRLTRGRIRNTDKAVPRDDEQENSRKYEQDARGKLSPSHAKITSYSQILTDVTCFASSQTGMSCSSNHTASSWTRRKNEILQCL